MYRVYVKIEQFPNNLVRLNESKCCFSAFLTAKFVDAGQEYEQHTVGSIMSTSLDGWPSKSCTTPRTACKCGNVQRSHTRVTRANQD